MNSFQPYYSRPIYTYAQLKAKFPVMFERCAFGLSDEDPWMEIISRLCESIDWEANGALSRAVIEVRVDQVKEEFGGLRFYFSTSDCGGNSCEDTQRAYWSVQGMVTLAENLCSRKAY